MNSITVNDLSRRTASIVAGLLLLAVSFAASATTLNDLLKDVSEPVRLYYSVHYPSSYYPGVQTPCTNELPQTQVQGQYTYTYSNPRAQWHPQFGLVCTIHYVITSNWTGQVTSEGDADHQILYVQLFCPKDAALVNGMCEKPRSPEMGRCDKCGNPVLPGRQAKVQLEVDYKSATLQNPLLFSREYSSWHFKPLSGGLGPNWFIPIFGRYLTFDPSPTFIAATRAAADTRGWDLSGGVWVARSATSDLLETFSDGNGSSYRYYDSSRQAYEFYSATGALLRIQELNGDGYTLTYSTSSTPSSIAPVPGLLIGIAASNGAQIALTYDNQSLLKTMQDPAGQTYTYAYGDGTADVPAGYLKSVTYPDATSRQYKYEDSKGPKYYFPPTPPYTNESLSAFATNVGGANPIATDVTNLANLERLVGENSFHPLTGIVEEDGNRYATWQYDARGRPISSAHANGTESFSITYSTANSVQVTSPLGSVNTYNYSNDQNGYRRVLQTISGSPCLLCGPYKSYSYNGNGTVALATDWNNRLTSYSYNSRGLETLRTEGYATGNSRTISTQWHSSFSLPTAVSIYAGDYASGTPKRTTSFTYDTSGNLLTKTITDPTVTPNVSRTWTYTRDGSGRVLTEDGPRTDVTDVTTYIYYSCTTGYQCGQLYTVTNALGHVTTYNSYNAHGQPTQITDANGLVTSLGYDSRLRLADRCTGGTLPSCSGGELTHIDYWSTGLVKKVTNPGGSFIEYTYDAAARLTQINDGALNKIVYTVDAMGNRTAENTYDPSNALRRAHTRVFNTLNQLWKDVNAAGTANVTTTFGYDNNGNQTSTNSPLSRNSTSQYDELNRTKQITDPASGITSFVYDTNDNLTSVTDPRNLVTSYTYNGFGDLKTQTSPDTGLTTSVYDSGGNLDTSTDSRGAVADFSYDSANRVTSVSFTRSGTTDQTINYVYDAGTSQKGQLTSAGDANHSLAWSYDTKGGVTGKAQTVGSTTLSMGYGYNSAGQLGSVTLPSGNVVSLGYNSNSQVTSLTLNGSTSILNSITYDPFGPITSWIWGNGTSASRAFDTDGKITQVDNASGASLKNYGYDDAFRITGISDAGDSTLSWTYGYDLLDRLNSATKTGTTQGWTFDANGNRLTETGSTPSTYTNATTSNRVSSISGSLARTYGYDAAGNTLSYAAVTFTYNNRGRMATATNGSATASYIYDALGQRIKRTAAGVTTLYVYDEAGHLAGEYTATGALIQETVWLGDMPVATLRPNGSGGVIVYYVHVDHLNTPRLVTDTSNNVRWRWDSDPFGTTTPNENPSGLGTFVYNLRFPGQQFDSVAGLNYNYFRDYDSWTGRYVKSDPIGLRGGINTFSYADSSPPDVYDNDGLQGARVAEVETMRWPRVGMPGWQAPLVPLPRPTNVTPQWTIPYSESASSCSACFHVYWVAKVSGTSRSWHSRQGNQSYFQYLNSPVGPINGRYVSRDMLGPNGSLRNPRGFEWHHPRDRPGEIWLVARCQHQGDIWQSSIHPDGVGGFAQQFRQSVGPAR